MVDFDTMSIVAEMGEDPSVETHERVDTVEMIRLIHENPQARFRYYSKLSSQWYNLKEGATITLNIDSLWVVEIPTLRAAITHNQLTLLIEALKTDNKEINADNIAEALGIKKKVK